MGELLQFIGQHIMGIQKLSKSWHLSPIHEAAWNGHIEIVKILAPLTDNPNAPDADGRTPIHKAALNGHTEFVKILAPLTSNPNASDKYINI